jgi:hypothetical protein
MRANEIKSAQHSEATSATPSIAAPHFSGAAVATHIAELVSLCATYHTALVDAQATASRINAILTQAAAQASSNTTQQRTLLEELSVFRRQARSSHRNFQELKSILLQQLDTSCHREHKHLLSISELENQFASTVKENKRLWTQRDRFPERLKHAIRSTQSKVKLRDRIFEVRWKRKIPDLVRYLIMDLTAAGVSLNSMFKVIELVGEAMGFEIQGHFARLAVNHIFLGRGRCSRDATDVRGARH